MPTVTIVEPAAGQPFGPGFRLTLEHDVIGPLETGTFWSAELGDVDDGFTWFVNTMLVATAVQWNFGAAPGVQDLQVMLPAFPHGGPARLRVRMYSPSFAVLAEGHQDVVLDAQSGALYLIDQKVTTLGSGSPAVLEELAVIKQSVQLAWPGLGILSPIADLLAHPAAGLLGRSLITPDRSGEGTLVRPSGPVGVNAFGLAWHVVSYPPQLGIDEGAPDTWEIPILHLALTHTDASGFEYTSSWERFGITDSRWLFEPAFPTLVSYWIQPGVAIRFYWVLFGGG